MEILVEGDQVVPARVGLETLDVTEHRTSSVGVVGEDADQPLAQLLGDRPQAEMPP